MDLEKVFRRIDELTAEFEQFWVDLANTESPTSCKEGLDAAGALFTAEAERRGWLVEKRFEPHVGDPICITALKEAAGQPVVLSGHLDTVHPLGLFGTPACHIEGDKLYGPGVLDCKGGAVAGLLAIIALTDCGFDARPLKLFLQMDEEVHSRYSEHRNLEFMAECAKDAAAFVNLEPGDGRTAVTRRKGIMRLECTVHGRMAHSSACWRGANAIEAAAHIIPKLQAKTDREGTTYSVNEISGGTAGNTVPNECRFTVDIRFMDEAARQAAERFVRETVAETGVEGCTAEMRVVSIRAAMPASEKNDALFARINECLVEAGLGSITPRLAFGGSDAADMTLEGIPTVDSMGVIGAAMHTPNEYAELSSLPKVARQMAAIMALL